MLITRSWYANLRANPRSTVHLGLAVTADLSATAAPVDEQTRRRVIATVLDLQNRQDVTSRLSRRQNFDHWMAHSPLIEIVSDDGQLSAATSHRAQ